MMALGKFSRKAAEQAPGDISMTPKEPTKNADEEGRNNSKTKVRSFSVRLDLWEKLDTYRITHRTKSGTIPSASSIVNEALEAYLK
ncbi:hypothetical protein NUU00_10035 (plasmid) [Bifidobacterium breve]|uniref:Uncharacterized protein n=2 Tax=Bacillati TaxID=1783272 RepID=A0A9E1M298_9FIRM|nr:hypothetical protein [Bifidobacterium breve]MBS6623267.1 hypothetical protein [Faecalibacterium prausnitzii]UUY18121.1 hypothetical protein NUU00_10035 [Bifidobacterium breve]